MTAKIPDSTTPPRPVSVLAQRKSSVAIPITPPTRRSCDPAPPPAVPSPLSSPAPIARSDFAHRIVVDRTAKVPVPEPEDGVAQYDQANQALEREEFAQAIRGFTNAMKKGHPEAQAKLGEAVARAIKKYPHAELSLQLQ